MHVAVSWDTSTAVESRVQVEGLFGVWYDNLVVVQQGCVWAVGIVDVREAAVVSWEIVGMHVCAAEP